MSPSRLLYVTLLCTVLCGLSLGSVRRPSVVACDFSRNIQSALSASTVIYQTTHCGKEKLSGSFIGDSSILLDKPDRLETVAVDPEYWRLILIDMDVALLELRRIGLLFGSTCEA
uniref:Uncharacterized protein n=1 Tax=Branchiostoma floridae TaxID=7739 RepID=C3YR85_BRAFL|eukprot:XP_002601070.1 hypothetical protein BRAFLDRAFT_75505 [Branchiostoma floridae]